MRQTAPAPRDTRWLALVVLCAGMLMIILDGTIVTVALPSIQTDLEFTQSRLAWVVNAYLIPFGGLLLLAGRLGDLIGRKRVFLTGMIVFTAASLLCGAANGPGLLLAARFVQGVGGALASAVVLGMVVTMFPEPRDRARAFGVFSFVGAAGASIGLLAGGLLTQALSWHWIFFVNLPIGVAATVLAVRLLAADRGIGLGQGADVLGALLVTAGLMLGVYTIVGVTDHGWGSPHTLGFGAVALVLLAAFVGRQAYAAKPLLPLRVFSSRDLSAANLIQALMVAAMFGFQFLVALYLQRVLGYGPAETGLAMFPTAAVIGTLSLGFAARLITRFGPRGVLLAGLVLIVAGLALLTRVPAGGGYLADLLPAMLLLSAGFGAASPALTMLAMSGATSSDSGLAAGLFSTSQQVGAALGLAALTTLATARANQLLDAGRPVAVALTGGYHLAFGVGAALVAAAIGLGAAVLRRPPSAPEPGGAASVPPGGAASVPPGGAAAPEPGAALDSADGTVAGSGAALEPADGVAPGSGASLEPADGVAPGSGAVAAPGGSRLDAAKITMTGD